MAGSKRDALVEAGLRAVAAGTATEFAGFVKMKDVASAAGASVGALYHHFPADRGGEKLLMEAVLEHALLRSPVTDASVELIEGATHLFSMGQAESALELVTRIAEVDVSRHSCGDGADAMSMCLIAAAAALNDGRARSVLRESYKQMQDLFEDAYTGILEAWNRTIREPHTIGDLTRAITALADGWAIRMRFDPDATPDQFAGFVKGIIATFTTPKIGGGTQPLRALDDDLPTIDDMLANQRPRPAGRGDAEKQGLAADAAMALYDEGGWAAVTTAAVAERAGIDPRTVKAHFPTRNHLAAPVWSQFMSEIAAGIDRNKRRKPVERVRRFCRQVAGVVFDHKELTGALLQAVYEQTVYNGRAQYDDSSDPRSWVPLPPLLAGILQAGADAFRDELGADTEQGSMDLAVFFVNTLLNRAMTRTDAPDLDAVADFVCDVCLHGAARSRH
jgi:AcrR family transcriptional regulator